MITIIIIVFALAVFIGYVWHNDLAKKKHVKGREKEE